MAILSKATQKRQVRTKTVEILMDPTGADERDALSRAFMEASNAHQEAVQAARKGQAADARLGKPGTAVAEAEAAMNEAQAALDAHNASMAESILYIRLEALPNAKWRQLHAGFPPRKGNPNDQFGYNVEEVLRRVLEDHCKVSMDGAEDGEWERPDKDEVKEFLDGVPGGEWSTLFYAMHQLNENPISTAGLKKG